MCPGDLSGQARIVVRDIGLGIVRAVLELDIESRPKLLDVERRRLPVDADVGTDALRLGLREVSTARTHEIRLLFVVSASYAASCRLVVRWTLSAAPSEEP